MGPTWVYVCYEVFISVVKGAQRRRNIPWMVWSKRTRHVKWAIYPAEQSAGLLPLSWPLCRLWSYSLIIFCLCFIANRCYSNALRRMLRKGVQLGRDWTFREPWGGDLTRFVSRWYEVISKYFEESRSLSNFNNTFNPLPPSNAVRKQE